jgi:hypothetical protein
LLENLDKAIKNASTDAGALVEAKNKLLEQGITEGPLDNIQTIAQHFNGHADLYHNDQTGTVKDIKQSCLERILKAEREDENPIDAGLKREVMKRWCQGLKTQRRRARGPKPDDNGEGASTVNDARARSTASTASESRMSVDEQTQFVNSLSEQDVNAFRILERSSLLSEQYTNLFLPSGRRLLVNDASVSQILSMVNSMQGSNSNASTGNDASAQ